MVACIEKNGAKVYRDARLSLAQAAVDAKGAIGDVYD